jgi:hypothetical protein
MTRRIAEVSGAMGLLAASALLVGAQGPPPRTMPDVTPSVSISVTGSYGGASISSIAFGTKDWYESLMFVGDTGDRNICMGGTTGSRVGTAVLPPGQRPVLIWRVAARLESFDGATAVIGVRWSREIFGNDIQPAGPFEGQFTWRVSEGSFRTLDFVRQTPAAVDGCDTMGVELRYRAPGPEELREAALGYDVWLVQRMPSGERRTRRLQTSAQQGTAVSFALPTVGLDMPPRPDGSAAVLDLRVTGHLTGRVRRDGRIDLAVDAGRMVGVRGSNLMSGNSGRTQLTVAENETVEFQPPPIQGDDDGLYADVLRAAPTAIRVRARRLW